MFILTKLLKDINSVEKIISSSGTHNKLGIFLLIYFIILKKIFII